MPFKPFGSLLLLSVLVGSWACVSVPTRRADSAAERPDPLAQVEAEFIPDPSRLAPHLLDGQEFVQPHPIITPLPLYPTTLAASRPVIVVLRFVVGPDGMVADIKDSPLGPAGAPVDPAFRAAAEDAVLNWRFVPAAIKTVAPGEDLDNDSKPDYTVLVESNRIPVYLDVRFTFEMIEGERRVRAD